MRPLCTILFFVLLVQQSAGQRALLLQKVGTDRRFQYESGDMIRLQTTHRAKYYDVLSSVFDSAILIGSQIHLKLDEILKVQRTGRFHKKFGIRLAEAGLIFIGITAINGLANNEQVFQPAYLLIGASVTAAGVILIPTSRYTYKIGVRWKLKVLESPLPGL